MKTSLMNSSDFTCTQSGNPFPHGLPVQRGVTMSLTPLSRRQGPVVGKVRTSLATLLSKCLMTGELANR